MEKKTLIVLAGGKGTRLLPLTNTTPKPLLRVANLPSVEYSLSAALPFVDEIIMVVGYLGDSIRNYFGSSFKDIPITYAYQREQLGTAHAFYQTKELIKNQKLLVINGDDIYSENVFEAISKIINGSVGQKESNWQSFGVFKLKDEKYLIEIVEKPTEFIGDLVNIGIYAFERRIFDCFNKISTSPRGELEITDMLTLLAKNLPVEIVKVESGWIPLTYPWSMLEATEKILKTIEPKNEGTIEDGATIRGKLILGKRSIVKTGAYLEGNFIIGEDCVIGPNCYLKGFASLGNGTVIGNGVEITRSVLGEGVNVRHLSYIGDSLLGNNVNIAAGCIVANLKHDESNILVMINGKLTDTKRQKFGAIIGDNVKLGVDTLIFPGRKIDNDVWTLPGDVVKEDKVRSQI